MVLSLLTRAEEAGAANTQTQSQARGKLSVTNEDPLRLECICCCTRASCYALALLEGCREGLGELRGPGVDMQFWPRICGMLCPRSLCAALPSLALGSAGAGQQTSEEDQCDHGSHFGLVAGLCTRQRRVRGRGEASCECLLEELVRNAVSGRQGEDKTPQQVGFHRPTPCF